MNSKFFPLISGYRFNVAGRKVIRTGINCSRMSRPLVAKRVQRAAPEDLHSLWIRPGSTQRYVEMDIYYLLTIQFHESPLAFSPVIQNPN